MAEVDRVTRDTRVTPEPAAGSVLVRVALSGSARWLSSGRTFAFLVLALGLTCLAWSLWPLLPSSPRLLDGLLGVALSVVAVGLLVGAPQLSPRRLFVLLLLPLATLAALTATRASDTGVAVLASGWTLLAVTAALYLTRFLLLASLILQTLARVLATWINPLEDIALVTVVSTTGAVIVASVVFILIDAQRHLIAELSRMASRDPLTGVLNRRGAELEAQAVRSVAQRASAPTTVAVIDLDDFKAINDRYGHQTGDDILRAVTQHWSARLRTGDVLGRIGGDEFVLVLPETTPDAAEALLRRLRQGNPINWTSGAVHWSNDQTLDEALARADALLYQGKSRRDTHSQETSQ